MPTSSLIGALRVSLGLDSAQFEAGTKRARVVAQRDVRAIQTELSKVRQGFDNLRNAAITTALVAAGKRALDYASSLGEVSQQLGVSTRALQEYRYGASQAGVEQKEMDAALGKLTRTLGEAAAGAKEPAKAFRDLGIDIRRINTEDALPQIAESLSRIRDPATRARYEVDLFGKSGQKLDPLLTQGASGIETMRKEAERLGLVMGDDLISAADEVADRLSALKQQLETQLAVAVARNADGIMKLADAFVWAGSKALEFFSTMKGVERIKRDEGWASGFFAGWGEQKEASTAAGYEQRRRRALSDAQGRYNRARAAGERPAVLDTLQRDVTKQSQLLFQAQMQTIAEKVPPKTTPAPSGERPVVSSGSKKKGPKDRTQDYLERYERELASLTEEQLQLQREITTDVHERARLEHQRIDTAKAAYEHDVDNRQKAGELNAAQAQALKTAYEANATREHTLVNWKLDDELVEQELDLTRSRLENESQLLRGELDAARTQGDRRRLQLAILVHEKALERASLEALIAKHDSTAAEKEIAQAKLDQLDKEYGQREGAAIRDTLGPMAQYLNSLPRTADELKERLESIKVDALNNSLDLASRNVLKLKGFAGDLFNQLIADVIRLNLQSALTGGGGLLGGLGKLLGLAGTSTATATGSSGGMDMRGFSGAIPGYAGGGTQRIGGIPGIDRNILSINGIPRARVSANENFSVGYGNDRAAARIEIVEHPGFASRVVGISGNVAIETTRSNNQYAYKRGRQRLG